MLECLFQSQKSVAGGVDLLYRAVVSLVSIEKRQTYLLKFFKIVRSASRPEQVRCAILTRCHFSQSDVTLLVEAI